MDVIGYQPHLIHPTAFVAPNATVIGQVRISAGASVWFGAVLRGDAERIELGEGSNIQDNVVVHADPGYPALIAENVTIGHGAVIHGCVIEAGALIGMNATILNGARVGAEAVIGAGAVVAPGVHIPPGSLAVGIPARVVRELDAEGRAAGMQGASTYQVRAQRYREYYQHSNPSLRSPKG